MSRERGAARRARRVVPFWILQAAEYFTLVALADLSLHVENGRVLVGAGVVYAALAVLADGPLGLLRICPRRLHVTLVVVASVAVALVPVVPALRPDLEGILILEVIAVGMLRLATLTSTAPARPRAVAGSGPLIDSTATVVTDPTPPTPTPTPATTGPPTPAVTAARMAGRAAGAASAAAVQHRPAAEAQVKRALRGAGRLAGRMRPDTPEADPPAG
jgi:hypothetical protein